MQKENLSALVDGEQVDDELIETLSHDAELHESWYRYHLIRNIIRGDIDKELVSVDLAANIMAAVENEPTFQLDIPEQSQPTPNSIARSPFKVAQTWLNSLGQMGIAAGVTFAVVIGFQYYGADNRLDANQTPGTSLANAVSLGEAAKAVSFDMVQLISESQKTPSVQNQTEHPYYSVEREHELQVRMHNGQSAEESKEIDFNGELAPPK